MTDSERALLRRRARSPAVGLTRTFGTLMGVVPLTLMLFGILGVPFVAINYTVIVLVASVLAVGLGIASLALRAPVSSALSNNRVVEIRGVPNRAAAAAGGGSTVELGGATFELDPALSGRLHDGRLNLLAFVPVGLGARRHAGKARVWLLGANGEALPAPGAAFVDVPPEFLQQLKTAQAASMAVGAKRRR